VHDANNEYTWSVTVEGFPPVYADVFPNGTLFTSFLASLNGGDYYDPFIHEVVNPNPTSCFENHCDWRLPNIEELIVLQDFRGDVGHRIDPIFRIMQSCLYWSETTITGSPNASWAMDFFGGNYHSLLKASNNCAIAVRNGL